MAQRVPTGIKGLDEMLADGLLAGSIALVRGAPGTGKTSLGLQFLIHGATRLGEIGLFISFEEFPISIYRDAEALGWDLGALEQANRLHLMFTSPEVFLSNLKSPDSQLNRLLLQADVRRVVLDSISHFDRLTGDEIELRRIYTSVVNGLRRERVTTILLGEEGPAMCRRAFRGGLSFLVDTIILLRYVEIESAMQRAIAVLKMRGSSHAKEIRRYEIHTGGIEVMEVFEGREGILSGSPHRSMP